MVYFKIDFVCRTTRDTNIQDKPQCTNLYYVPLFSFELGVSLSYLSSLSLKLHIIVVDPHFETKSVHLTLVLYSVGRS